MDRMEKQRPEWRRGDTIKSLRDLGSLALDEIVKLIPMKIDLELDDKD